MREATNLSWTDTPFGAARRPFADRTSLLAAFSISASRSSPAAGAVYLPLTRTRALPISDTTLRFGFHAVAAEEPAEAAAVVTTVDALLVQARRQAAIVAGHRFADELASLTGAAAGQPTRGITAIASAWTDGTSERGLARLHDTASEPTPAALAEICSGYHLHGLPPDTHPAAAGTSWAVAQVLRHLVMRALAIALIAAWHAGHYQWDTLQLDAVVEAAAWDQLTDLTVTPVP